jgi:hypothetical protein
MGMVPLTVLSNRGGSARGSRQVYASASPGDGGTEPGPGSQSDPQQGAKRGGVGGSVQQLPGQTGMPVGLSVAGPGRADSVIAQAVARVVPLCTVNERLKARLMFGGSAQPPGYQAALRP